MVSRQLNTRCFSACVDVITGSVRVIKKTDLKDLGSAKRQYREMLLLNNLSHPNVLHLIDVFSADQELTPSSNMFYLVLPHMECNLRELIGQKGLNLHDENVINLSHQLLCGLEYIHSRALIHRDLKPANIGVTKDATRQWLLRILDFGNARLITREAKMTTIEITTPCYRATESIYQQLDYTEKGQFPRDP
ncbi:Mitogen-activated protein kinase 13 [Cichlidogyrus casuarinus]|uniref:Mitogen-activated protein kinase 13 n=1 Tax=Cichlidogyrus casuarinus TaxID=1844966 RepID=A0ABD2PSK4_9PLAT